MKKPKKALLMAAIFTAAFNMNACAYGPPDDGYDTDEPESADNTAVSESADSSSESRPEQEDGSLG